MPCLLWLSSNYELKRFHIIRSSSNSLSWPSRHTFSIISHSNCGKFSDRFFTLDLFLPLPTYASLSYLSLPFSMWISIPGMLFPFSYLSKSQNNSWCLHKPWLFKEATLNYLIQYKFGQFWTLQHWEPYTSGYTRIKPLPMGGHYAL